jgi:ATP-binding cassette, subfamily B, bacterial PglK
LKKYRTEDSPIIPEIKKGFSLLESSAKLRMFYVTLVSSTLSVLDLLAVGLLGLSASIAVRGVQERDTGDRARFITEFLGVSRMNLEQQVLVLSSLAISLFLFKTVVTSWLSRKIIFFIQREAAKTTNSLLAGLFRSPYGFIRENSIQERIFATTIGVSGLIVGVVGALFLIFADVVLLLVLIAGLIYLDPVSGSIITLIFLLIAALLNRVFHKRATQLGHGLSVETVKSNEAISELLLTLKERRIRDSENSFLESIYLKRILMSDLQSEMKFIPMVSKYVFEIGLVFITVTVTLLQFYLSESSRAVANLVVFLAASGRIAPAILRIQQGIIGIKNNLGGSSLTQDLIKKMESQQTSVFKETILDEMATDRNVDSPPSITIENVSFRYTESALFSIKKISVDFTPGSFTALVGPSGGGKSTLIDLCLGFYKPSEGKVLISGEEPDSFIRRHPGKVGFVPQDTLIIKNTLRENILLGIEDEFDDDEWTLLIKSCGLESLFRELPNGLDTKIGEFGNRLSGGQKQRIGIARAMILKPQIIFLDEATSALDAETENLVTQLIYGTREERVANNRTVVAIAHRISSIRHADQIIFIDNGQILGEGTYEELLAKQPSFAHQAQLMGLQ